VRPRVRLTLEVLEGRITPSSPRLGPPFQVDPGTSASNGTDAVAVNAAGYSIVLWSPTTLTTNQNALMGQIYDPQHHAVGGPFQVNTDSRPSNVFYTGDVTADQAGNFDIVWSELDASGQSGSSNLFLRSFAAQGTPRGDQVPLSAAHVDNFNGQASVTTDQAGDLVLTWTTGPSIGFPFPQPSDGLYLMRMDTQGNPLTSREQLSHTGGNSQVAAGPNGYSLVVWQDNDQIIAQYFLEDGNPLGTPFVVSPATGKQDQPEVAVDGQNRFVIVWEQDRADGSGMNDVLARRFDSLGHALGGPFQVNAPTALFRSDPAVAADAQGNFTVVWASTTTHVSGRCFDAQGNPTGGEFQIDTTPNGSQGRLAFDATGHFLVAWASGDSPDVHHIFGRWSVPPPVVNMPGTQSVLNNTVLMNTTLTFSAATGNAITVADAAAAGTDVETVRLQDIYGTLHVSNTGGLSSISGNDTAFVSLTGTLAALNAALDGLRYRPFPFDQDYSDWLSVQLQAADGSTGSGGVGINVLLVNVLPVVTVSGRPVPPGTLTLGVNDDWGLFFLTANNNAIVVGDPNVPSITGGIETVYLQSGVGTLHVQKTDRLSSIVGNGTSLIAMSGTIDALNWALDDLAYIPPALYQGPDVLSVLINDNGNVGLGGPMTGSGVIALNVVPGNVPPTVNGPHHQTAGAGPLTFSAVNGNAITVGDPDGLGGNETVYVQVLTGTLTPGNTSGLASSSGSGSRTLALTGTLSALNTALDGLKYQAAGGTTLDYLNVMISDAGNTNGRPKTALLSTSISIDGSGDIAPAVSGPASATFNTAGLTFSVGNGNAIHLSDGDANGATETVFLQVMSGNLTPGSTSGVTVQTAPHALALSGTLPALNAALDGLLYTPAASASSDYLSVLLSDGTKTGNLGLGLARDSSANLLATISAPSSQSVAAGAVLVFSEANSNAIHIADGDANGSIETVTLQVLSGRLAVGNTAGLASVSGNGTSSLTLTGTVAALNAALDGLELAPPAGVSSDWLSILVSDPGTSGGPPRSSSAGLPITVTG
jgi:hypothetical protein